MKNTKGFTLVELIVTIAIISIISGIAYGSITTMQIRNRNKRYQTYEQVMINGAKLYVDHYSADLWADNIDNVCYTVSYEKLRDNNLIQKYKQNGEQFDDANSKVYFVRKNGEVNYYAYLKINSLSNKLIYESDVVKMNCSVATY